MPNPPKKPTVNLNLYVDVKRINEATMVVTDYSITGDPNNPYVDANGNIDLKGAGKANLTFLVTNSTKPKIEFQFPDDPYQAFWIKKGSKCPDKPGTHAGEVEVNNDKANKLKLKVADHNKVRGKFTYALRFEHDGGKIITLDPVIINSGGGGEGFHWEPGEIAAAVGGVAAAALALLGLKRIFDKRRDDHHR